MSESAYPRDTTNPIVAVHLSLLRAGSLVAGHAVDMFDRANGDERLRLMRDAIVVAKAASAVLDAAVRVAESVEYEVATSLAPVSVV